MQSRRIGKRLDESKLVVAVAVGLQTQLRDVQNGEEDVVEDVEKDEEKEIDDEEMMPKR